MDRQQTERRTTDSGPMADGWMDSDRQTGSEQTVTDGQMATGGR